MKNTSLLILLSLFFTSCMSYYPNYLEQVQEIENNRGVKIIKNVQKTKILPFSGNEFIQTINTSTNDTTYRVVNFFQNSNYQYIVDIGILSVINKKQLNQLIVDLEGCLKYLENHKQVYSVKNYDYHLYIPDYTKHLYVRDDDKWSGLISSKNLKLWIDWLKSLDLPK